MLEHVHALVVDGRVVDGGLLEERRKARRAFVFRDGDDLHGCAVGERGDVRVGGEAPELAGQDDVEVARGRGVAVDGLERVADAVHRDVGAPEAHEARRGAV